MNYEKKKCVTPVYSQNLTALGYLGRFVSVDPLAKNLPIRWLYTPQNANFYTYARNNPLVFFDPTGEKAETYSGFINEGKTAIASVQNAGTNPLTENPMVTAKELHRWLHKPKVRMIQVILKYILVLKLRWLQENMEDFYL